MDGLTWLSISFACRHKQSICFRPSGWGFNQDEEYVTYMYSTVSVMFKSLTLTNVESRMSRDFFPWILRGISVDFA